MNDALPILAELSDIKELESTLSATEPVIALIASCEPRQKLDVIVCFYEELRARGKQVILLLHPDCMDFFWTMGKKPTGEHIYILEDRKLVAHCHYIDLLVCHEESLPFYGKSPGFRGKVLIFPHNMFMLNPYYINCWVDYIPTVNNETSVNGNALYFDYNRIPNSIKKNGALPSSFCTLIPCGYPKIDLLIKERERIGEGPHKLVAFFPLALFITLEVLSENYIISLWYELINLFFEAYPDQRFVFRPFGTDRTHHITKGVCREFGHHPGFIFDDGPDDKRYLVGADYLITDKKSSTSLNFSLSTLRPAISFNVDPGQSTFKREKFGYSVSTAQQAVQAIADALDCQPDWEKRIGQYRNTFMPNAGKCLTYLADNIDLCVEGKGHKDWLPIDKGDTPSGRVSDWLKFWNRLLDPYVNDKNINFAQIPLFFLYRQSRKWFGDNSKIALGFLNLTIRLLPHWATITYDPQRRKESTMECLDDIFLVVPPAQIFGLLRYILKKDPDNMYALIWLMEATTRWGDDGQLVALTECLSNKQLPLQLAELALQRLYPALLKTSIATPDRKPLLILLEASLGKHPWGAFPQITLVYINLLLQANRFDEAKKIFVQWTLKNDTDDINKEYSALAKFFMQESVIPPIY